MLVGAEEAERLLLILLVGQVVVGLEALLDNQALRVMVLLVLLTPEAVEAVEGLKLPLQVLPELK